MPDMKNRISFHILKVWMLPVLILLLVNSGKLNAQVTVETYKRAEYFLTSNLRKEIYHLEVNPNWIRGKEAFWHVTRTADGKRFFLTDTGQKLITEAFDHFRLAELLSKEADTTILHSELPFERIEVQDSGRFTFEWKNRVWAYNASGDSLASSPKRRSNDRTGISPDGKWRAFTRDYNLFAENLETGREIQLSFNGKRDYEYGSYYGWSDLMKGENGVRPERFTVTWSPDSRKILTQIADLRLAEKMFMLDFSQDERFRPELLSYYRGSPGDTTVVMIIPVIFDVESRKEIVLEKLARPHFMPVNLGWDKQKDSQQAGSALYGFSYQRGYKQLDYIRADAEDGSIKSLFTDVSDTFVENTYHFLDLENGQFVVSSERSGWKHLYLVDRNTGKLVRQLTSGEFVVSRLHFADSTKEWIYFEATGREKGRNVYYPHLYKVRLDGTGLTLLTGEDAYHDIRIQRDKEYFVDNFSRIDQPTRSVLRELKTGQVVMEISTADISNLTARGYQSPKPFSAIAKDGKTEIFGVYFLPANFDPDRKYPVIDYSYTGPFTAITPKSFRDGLMGLQQPMAELGFVVVCVDGLGTAGRSKAFQEVSYRNLGDGTTDHVLAIWQLAGKLPFLDIDRVGIFGHSAGGYDAGRAMLLHPDFYKVGVASAGDHDHRMEKAWWPEMYMGYPVGDFYHEQSNITSAHKLQGRLLLAHGAVDENVNPSATYKFAEALIKAGKDFDLFIWPSRNHSFGRTEGDYFTKKRWDYFIQHLLGETPLLHYRIGQ